MIWGYPHLYLHYEAICLCRATVPTQLVLIKTCHFDQAKLDRDFTHGKSRAKNHGNLGILHDFTMESCHLTMENSDFSMKNHEKGRFYCGNTRFRHGT